MTIPTMGRASPTSEADLLRNTERARLRALVSADLDQARQFHAPDFQSITPIGAALSKEDYMGAIASGHLKYLTWQPADIAVRLYDGAAVLRYRAQLEVVFGGHKIPLSDYWHTDTYEDRDGQWMVVWSHATAIR
ncbi:nuclear transport factor 2 family protein [Microvirga rosea]|uniref:nuclear transport factor 2 family protein n=1 Tax=Microvirga rosea TaxID=2715425 RepID=UPI001D0B6D8A|nr:nuclear transport factor 2 family protein [Microvirga rosea]MCB8819425.1 nuclear transport factor 2 family protein [Microvirga rosea]